MKSYKIKSHNSVPNYSSDCIICGKKLVYSNHAEMNQCSICNNKYETNCVCENGHYVCDTCHSTGIYDLLPNLKNNTEKDPLKLMQHLMKLPYIHMHGPEHHAMVPCVILTAYKNCGGNVELEHGLNEAISRGSKVPGGICGNWGSCGAAIGAGIFVSIATGSNPLNKMVWHLPNLMTSRCLERIASVGGPRCCKRDSYIAIETAIVFASEYLGVQMPLSTIKCSHSSINKECIKSDCPYWN